MDAVGGEVRNRSEADTSRVVADDLDGADHRNLALVAASRSPGNGILPGPVRDCRFKEAAVEIGLVAAEQFDNRVGHEAMTGPRDD